jgi:hypothetical protein
MIQQTATRAGLNASNNFKVDQRVLRGLVSDQREQGAATVLCQQARVVCVNWQAGDVRERKHTIHLDVNSSEVARFHGFTITKLRRGMSQK